MLHVRPYFLTPDFLVFVYVFICNLGGSGGFLLAGKITYAMAIGITSSSA